MRKQDILAACRDNFEAHYANCSGFVNAVTTTVGFPLRGTADQQLACLENSPLWESIDRSTAVADVGGDALVIAGLKSGEHNPARTHGRVVVVVDGPLYRNMYRRAWGGSIGTAQSRGTRSVGAVWNTRDRDNISYYRVRGA